MGSFGRPTLGGLAGPRASRPTRLALAALALAACVGCAHAQSVPRRASGVALLTLAKQRGVPLADPAALDPSIAREVDEAVGRYGSASGRVSRLLRLLHTGPQRFRFAGLTIPVDQAYRERRGDCITHAVLLVTLARQVG